MKKIMQKNDKIKQFVSLIFEGIEAWTKAGSLLVEMIEEDPDIVDKICDSTPGLSKDVLYRFEAIGRQELYPKLLASSGPGINHLIKMPYSLQKKHSTEPVPVLIDRGNKGYDTLLVSVYNLTLSQCRQVFAKNHIRDAAEQRAVIESEKKAAMRSGVQTEHLPYYIKGKRLIIRRDTELTKTEIKNILKML